MEFLPNDNTVIRMEGNHGKVTKITKTKISFEEQIRRSEMMTVRRGVMDDRAITIHAIKLRY